MHASFGEGLSIPAGIESDLPVLDVRLDDARHRIVIVGELDAAAAPALQEAISRLAHIESSECIVDVRGVSFIDAGGIGCLVAISNEVAARGGRLRIVGATAAVRRLFGIVGLSGLLEGEAG
jgi:anti-anti-sigma factor